MISKQKSFNFLDTLGESKSGESVIYKNNTDNKVILILKSISGSRYLTNPPYNHITLTHIYKILDSNNILKEFLFSFCSDYNTILDKKIVLEKGESVTVQRLNYGNTNDIVSVVYDILSE